MKDPTSEDYVPPNKKLMLKCTHPARWEKAEDDELRSFQQCEVMAKHPILPMGSQALNLKCIYTIKRDIEGNIIRCKARLVAQGFFQVLGMDYTDTYSPVAKFVSFGILLAISVQLGLKVHTMDVDTAFLNATLEEDI
jgi:Reverse transcriptase (RNA-dependent DNA polymerase)